MMDVTRTLLDRPALARLDRVAVRLRLERHLARLRKDHALARDCNSALRSVYGCKAMVVRHKKR
jgi:hypothetical protein